VCDRVLVLEVVVVMLLLLMSMLLLVVVLVPVQVLRQPAPCRLHDSALETLYQKISAG